MNFPSRQKPLKTLPSGKVMVPWPFLLPSLKEPTYSTPLGNVSVPWPFGNPSLTSPTYSWSLTRFLLVCQLAGSDSCPLLLSSSLM